MWSLNLKNIYFIPSNNCGHPGTKIPEVRQVTKKPPSPQTVGVASQTCGNVSWKSRTSWFQLFWMKRHHIQVGLTVKLNTTPWGWWMWWMVLSPRKKKIPGPKTVKLPKLLVVIWWLGVQNYKLQVTNLHIDWWKTRKSAYHIKTWQAIMNYPFF